MREEEHYTPFRAVRTMESAFIRGPIFIVSRKGVGWQNFDNNQEQVRLFTGRKE